MSPRRFAGMCCCFVLLTLGFLAPAAEASFGVNSLSATAFNQDGSIDLRAGSHPYKYTLGFATNHDIAGNIEGTLRDVIVELPPGLIGNPVAVPQCPREAFVGLLPKCPGNSQVGVATVRVKNLGTLQNVGVYNLSPAPGSPLTLGLSIDNNNSIQEASIRTGSDYGPTVSDITLPTNIELQSITETIWGIPMDRSHDAERLCLDPVDPNNPQIEGCSSDATRAAFLTLPTSCTGPLETTIRVDSVEEPGVFVEESVLSHGDGGVLEGINSCENPQFKPKIELQPEVKAADSATGLHVDIEVPQNEDPEGLATAHLKDTVVTLPKGLVVNPSAADGLRACTPEQVDLKGPGPAECPESSKIGTVEVDTPLLDHPLPGAVYLAKQQDNPFGSLLALYVTVDDPKTGVIVKLAGKVDPSGERLKATFFDNPQLPFEDFKLDFFGGPRAALTTPSTCGTYTTTGALTPWTAPEGQTEFPSDSFSIEGGPGGTGCARSEAEMPNRPSFAAGTMLPLAGAFSPFVLKLGRENGSQRLSALDLTLPPGLAAKLAGAGECSDAEIAAAEARSHPGEGALETQSPSCPESSEVGTVTVGSGSGSPVFVGGHAYLAGPYKGAPLSFVFVTPAVAGPFDLGTAVVRAAAYVDEETAQVTVKSDPIPTELQGIPLDVRSIAVEVNRKGFTLNPTSCEQMSLGGTAISTLGQSAALSNPFQIAGCRDLGFAPNLSLRFRGATHRGAHPRLTATLTAKPGEANTAFAQVKLPKAAFLDQDHIGTICTRVQFAAEACPAASVYGRAEAITPLLGYPLKGAVYLRSSSHKLPDLVVGFKGPAFQPIKFALAGKTDSVKGALRNTFEAAPDVPVSRFRLELFGGKRGLIELSEGFCAHPRATVRLRAHSGKAFASRPVVKAACGRSKRRRRRLIAQVLSSSL